MNSPVIKQLDHVIARVDDANALHALLSETFQLPVSWAVKSYASFTSGGIALGNLMLEILTVGEKSDAVGQDSAFFCGIAFECDSLEACVRELQKRGLRCSSVVPYVDSLGKGLPRTHLWSNAFLDGLMGSNFLTRYVIFSTKMPGSNFMNNLIRGSFIERQGMSRMFSGALCFLVEYEYQNFKNMPLWSDFRNHDEKRAAEALALKEKAGGALGVESVREVVVGVRDYAKAEANWNKLFAPVEASARGLWEIADGPAVRLVESESDEIQALILKVTDTERAKTFLLEKGMLGSTSGDQLRIDPTRLYGLDIRLV
jgi:hypothetical protein